MRELKYRIWDEDHREFLGNEADILLDQMGGLWEWNIAHEDAPHPIECKVCVEQFTGLRDKNGKEIYEGDIVECEDFGVRHLEVKFGMATEFSSDPYCSVKFVGWYAHETDGPEDGLHSGDIGKSVIIGNIHENVDLLKNLGLQK